MTITEGNQDAIIKEILGERVRGDLKWGEQNHHPFVWLAILGEEKGEADKAALEAVYEQDPWSNYRNELIHTAAVALAAIESFDRRKW